jgi:hypothetical protein
MYKKMYLRTMYYTDYFGRPGPASSRVRPAVSSICSSTRLCRSQTAETEMRVRTQVRTLRLSDEAKDVPTNKTTQMILSDFSFARSTDSPRWDLSPNRVHMRASSPRHSSAVLDVSVFKVGLKCL